MDRYMYMTLHITRPCISSTPINCNAAMYVCVCVYMCVNGLKVGKVHKNVHVANKNKRERRDRNMQIHVACIIIIYMKCTS